MKQITCFMIKPDGVEKRVAGKVIDRFEKEGFRLLAIKMIQPDRGLLEQFYSIHQGKPFFEPLMEFMLSGPSIPMAWEADDAISRGRKIIGATDSRQAEEGTLRRLYGTDNRRNLIHGSDSEESAGRELKILFGDLKVFERPQNLV